MTMFWTEGYDDAFLEEVGIELFEDDRGCRTECGMTRNVIREWGGLEMMLLERPPLPAINQFSIVVCNHSWGFDEIGRAHV